MVFSKVFLLSIIASALSQAMPTGTTSEHGLAALEERAAVPTGLTCSVAFDMLFKPNQAALIAGGEWKGLFGAAGQIGMYNVSVGADPKPTLTDLDIAITGGLHISHRATPKTLTVKRKVAAKPEDAELSFTFNGQSWSTSDAPQCSWTARNPYSDGTTSPYANYFNGQSTAPGVKDFYMANAYYEVPTGPYNAPGFGEWDWQNTQRNPDLKLWQASCTFVCPLV